VLRNFNQAGDIFGTEKHKSSGAVAWLEPAQVGPQEHGRRIAELWLGPIVLFQAALNTEVFFSFGSAGGAVLCPF